jgi:hypothetical protein
MAVLRARKNPPQMKERIPIIVIQVDVFMRGKGAGSSSASQVVNVNDQHLGVSPAMVHPCSSRRRLARK